jgi:hypothetical protein
MVFPVHVVPPLYILFIEEKPAPVMALVQRWNHHVEQREEIRRKFSVKIARKHRNGPLNRTTNYLLCFINAYFKGLSHEKKVGATIYVAINIFLVSFYTKHRRGIFETTDSLQIFQPIGSKEGWWMKEAIKCN